MEHFLSAHEKGVLRLVLEDGRMPCTEMGKRLGISSQAVGRILESLESSKIICGYTAVVDFEKLGIDVIAIAFFRFKTGSCERLQEEDIRQRLSGPHLIRVYRVAEGDSTHMVVYGFRSLRELDNYFHTLQVERGHISELMRLHVLSVSSILKDSPNELISKVLNELGKDVLARPEQPRPLKASRT